MNLKDETEKGKLLNEIHATALNGDHMRVTYAKGDELAMTHEVIRNMQSKLYHIAELVQLALGD